MSTGLNCAIHEIEPNRWFYLLEMWNAPKCAWDWREYALAFGPFATLEGAEQHLSDNHANPGGYWINRFDGEKPDEVLLRLIGEARRGA